MIQPMIRARNLDRTGLNSQTDRTGSKRMNQVEPIDLARLAHNCSFTRILTLSDSGLTRVKLVEAIKPGPIISWSRRVETVFESCMTAYSWAKLSQPFPIRIGFFVHFLPNLFYIQFLTYNYFKILTCGSSVLTNKYSTLECSVKTKHVFRRSF